MKIVYEDNHIIVVYKEPGEIVQGDKTGDVTLADMVREYIREKCHKPGNVYLGVVHRLDRPVAGLVCFARTSKALTRLNTLFATRDVKKTYWAITANCPEPEAAMLECWVTRNEKQNKSYCHSREVTGAKKAVLDYRVLAHSDRYHLIEVELHTGRHHQIRCQLAAIGCPIRGDLKYGAPRSNPDGSISLLSRSIEFTHPVSHELISLVSPLPGDKLWAAFNVKM